jgi:hypothetical protein
LHAFSAHQEAMRKEIERLRQVYEQQNLKMSDGAPASEHGHPLLVCYAVHCIINLEGTLHHDFFSYFDGVFFFLSLFVFTTFSLLTRVFFVYVTFDLVYCAKLW